MVNIILKGSMGLSVIVFAIIGSAVGSIYFHILNVWRSKKNLKLYKGVGELNSLGSFD